MSKKKHTTEQTKCVLDFVKFRVAFNSSLKKKINDEEKYSFAKFGENKKKKIQYNFSI